MLIYGFKVLFSAIILATVAELAKRNASLAALMAALPLTSILAFVWMRIDGVTPDAIGRVSMQIFWLALPSLLLFVLLPALIQRGLSFWPSLGAAMAATATLYLVSLPVLRKMGIRL